MARNREAYHEYFVEEEMEKGVVFERKQCAYEFVKPQSKKDKVLGKNKKSR